MKKRFVVPCALILIFYLQHILHLQTLVHLELSSLEITKPHAVDALSKRLRNIACVENGMWVFEVLPYIF